MAKKIELVCRICGNVFDTTESHLEKYPNSTCSRECQYKMHAIRRKGTPLKGVIEPCSVCGKDAIRRPSSLNYPIYCSQTCRSSAVEARRLAREKRLALRPCPICGEEFSHEVNKTCSKECALVAQSETVKGENNPYFRTNGARVKKCLVCGTEFTCKRVGGKQIGKGVNYCSRKCSYMDPNNSSAVREIVKWLEGRDHIVELEKTWDWLRSPHNSRYVLRIDIYLPMLDVAIEFDGPQHYREKYHRGGGSSFRRSQKRDSHKDKQLADRGIPLLRIRYWPRQEEDLEKFLDEAADRIKQRNAKLGRHKV